jgi:type IV pilus assembly protein PilE
VIEIMMALAIMAIVARLAVPSYVSYISKSKAKGATGDLVGMGLALENRFQKTLAYPVYATSTTVAALASSRTGSVATDFGTWAPAQGAAFTYSVVSSSTTYTVTATGTGSMDCTMTLTSANVRTASGTSCGFSSW